MTIQSAWISRNKSETMDQAKAEQSGDRSRKTRLLFAVSLSEDNDRLFARVAELAGKWGAGITICHIIDKLPPNSECYMILALGLRDNQALKERLEADFTVKIKNRMKQWPADVLVEWGKPVKRILQHAGSGNYDMLVMGAPGGCFPLAGIAGKATGSTFRKILRKSPIPVCIIPRKSAK